MPEQKNNWIKFLKIYSKENDMTYSCALSDKNAKRIYKQLTDHSLNNPELKKYRRLLYL